VSLIVLGIWSCVWGHSSTDIFLLTVDDMIVFVQGTQMPWSSPSRANIHDVSC
jgi:hypothetical protein